MTSCVTGLGVMESGRSRGSMASPVARTKYQVLYVYLNTRPRAQRVAGQAGLRLATVPYPCCTGRTSSRHPSCQDFTYSAYRHAPPSPPAALVSHLLETATGELRQDSLAEPCFSLLCLAWSLHLIWTRVCSRRQSHGRTIKSIVRALVGDFRPRSGERLGDHKPTHPVWARLCS